MLTKTLLDLTAQDEGATGGTAYSAAVALAGLLSLDSLIATLNAADTAGTSPTLDVSFEYSVDGTNWFDTSWAFVQVTTVDSHQAVAFDKSTMQLGKFLRAKYIIGGTDTPAYTFDVVICGLADPGYWGE